MFNRFKRIYLYMLFRMLNGSDKGQTGDTLGTLPAVQDDTPEYTEIHKPQLRGVAQCPDLYSDRLLQALGRGFESLCAHPL